MFEVLITALSLWLFIGCIRLAFKIAWGTTKIVATILLAFAIPVLIICLIFAGGVVILFPAILIAGAFALLKKCA